MRDPLLDGDGGDTIRDAADMLRRSRAPGDRTTGGVNHLLFTE
jgi:hypothetical protein